LILATTFLSQDELYDAYGKDEMQEIIKNLWENNNVRLLHNIDAKTLHKSAELKKVLKDNGVDKIDKVIFNFPCVPNEQSTSQDAQLSEINENKIMVEEFFKSINELEKEAEI